MNDNAAQQPLRLWPGVIIVALQLFALYVPAYFAPASPAMFFGVMGSFTVGTLLLLPDQDLVLVLSERGDLALVRASTDGFEEVARMKALEGKTWNHPVVVDGVVYVRNGEEAAAYKL